jgi:transcriptional regulator with XRE-family HTH domain
MTIQQPEFASVKDANRFARGKKIGRAVRRVGERLRAARIQSGYTQARLGRRAGISQADISRLEAGAGRNGPELGSIIRYALACKCEIYLEITTADQIGKIKLRGLVAAQPPLELVSKYA